jgi:Histone methylation protein DOT1
VEDEGRLLQPEHLAIRLNLLDELDAIIGDVDLGAFKSSEEPEIVEYARALSSQLEAANETLYGNARAEISLEGSSPVLHQWLMELRDEGDAKRPRPGFGFDLLDEIVSGILQLRRPEESGLLPSPEMVFYQPTPVRHILDLIAACNFCRGDIFVDLGSGLGHVPLLVSILTGARTLGVEIQADYVVNAQDCAEGLNLSSARFVDEDARRADISTGTVFYLFSPFTGSILSDVLDRLHRESKDRQIKICSLGPCTRTLQRQAWLTANRKPDTERITLFQSR